MIPRPAVAEPGGPPPWTARTGITLASVVDALRRSGRLLAAGPPAGPPDDASPVRARASGSGLVAPPPAAVLVALFEEGGETRVLLTRRSMQLRTHRGQISFPGGRIDQGEDAVDAAVREAFEEIALDPAGVRPVGFLAPALAFAARDPITPVVAVLDGRPEVVANPDEVDRAFDASLADLAANFAEERWSEPGVPAFSMYFFSVEGETVWGATARMLVDLLTVVLAVPPVTDGSPVQ